MTPRSFIKQLEAEVRAMLKAGNYPEANQIFARHFDMDIFTQRCLIDHWRELNKEERVQLIDLFGRNIRKRMNDNIIFTKDDTDFKFYPVKITKADGIIKVENALEVKKGEFKLTIFLVEHNNRTFVVDYDVNGALLSRNYRGNFNYIIEKYGKTGLFDRLERKLYSVQ
jgi:ABC-type transporter MlaC component